MSMTLIPSVHVGPACICACVCLVHAAAPHLAQTQTHLTDRPPMRDAAGTVWVCIKDYCPAGVAVPVQHQHFSRNEVLFQHLRQDPALAATLAQHGLDSRLLVFAFKGRSKRVWPSLRAAPPADDLLADISADNYITIWAKYGATLRCLASSELAARIAILPPAQHLAAMS